MKALAPIDDWPIWAPRGNVLRSSRPKRATYTVVRTSRLAYISIT